MEYSFQNKQPLSIFFNDKLQATTFISSATRKSKFLWDVKSEDYIGIMEDITFFGDVYSQKNAFELMKEIFETADVPYNINPDLQNVFVSGYIPITNCRNALMHVAFAVQNVVDTSGADTVNVYPIDNEIKQIIPLKRIMQGQSFSDNSIVTGVEVTVHTYEPTEAYDNKGEIVRENAVVAYNAKEDGTGTNVLVKFEEPLHSLYVVSEGEILHSSANYAIVNATVNNFRLIGFKYNHTTQTIRKSRKDVNVLTQNNVKEIKDATMVTAINATMVLNSCFDWLSKVNSVNLSIVEGKKVEYGEPIKWGQRKWGAFKWGEYNPDVVTYDEPVKLGDHLQAQTEYLGVADGTLISQSYNLVGNTIVKKAVLK